LEPDTRAVEIKDREVLLALLWPYVDMAVTGHYGTDNRFTVQTSPGVMDVIQLSRPNPAENYVYRVVLTVKPYANDNITIGEATLTLEISPAGVRLTEYRQNADYPLPEYSE
jgi:hypothetical protein